MSSEVATNLNSNISNNNNHHHRHGSSSTLTTRLCNLFYGASDEEIIMTFLNEHRDDVRMLTHQWRFGQNVLHLACSTKRSYELIDHIMTLFPTMVSQPDHFDHYPLHQACRYHPSAEVIMRIITSYPPALDMKNTARQYPIHLLWKYNTPAVVQELVRSPLIHDMINQKDDDTGATALHDICLINRTDLIDIILQQPNIKVNLVNNRDGCSPLHVACMHHLDPDCRILTALLRHRDVDVNIQNYQGDTPLHMLFRSRFVFGYDRNLPSALSYLLRHPNINIHIQNHQHKTAYDTLAEKRDKLLHHHHQQKQERNNRHNDNEAIAVSSLSSPVLSLFNKSMDIMEQYIVTKRWSMYRFCLLDDRHIDDHNHHNNNDNIAFSCENKNNNNFVKIGARNETIANVSIVLL